jgi:hypothetical protein
MSPEAVEGLTDQIRGKLKGGEELTESEEGFLEELSDKGFAGESDGDPVFDWQEKRALKGQEVLEATGMEYRDARAKVGDLEVKEAGGTELTAEERGLVRKYNAIMGNRAVEQAHCPAGRAGCLEDSDEGDVECLANSGWTDEARVAALAVRRANPPSPGGYGGTPGASPDGEAWSGGALANSGWTDEARLAALAVRRAKAGMRAAKKDGQKKRRIPEDDGRMYAGGSKYFDEQTGKYVYPEDPRQHPDRSKLPWVPPGQRVIRKRVKQ